MKTDREIQQDVMDELEFDPSVNAENIGVSVKDRIVVLSGFVPSYAEKYAAEKAAFRVAGVKAVAEEIAVKLPGSLKRTDADIAKAAAHALEWHSNIPTSVHVSVENGQVILRGEVDWAYQRNSAGDAIRYLIGVKSITNHIAIRSHIQTDDVKDRIEKALVRSALQDAKAIQVEVVDGKVILSGLVHSLQELEDAKWAAWAAPGVTTVENHLAVT